jgi:hypothetical protein
VVGGGSLQCPDRPRRCGADLASYPAQLHPCLAEVYLKVGYWRERVGAVGLEEGYTLILINEH